jgi:uracil phosphoribosyltransferase
MLRVLDRENTILNRYVSELRDATIQQDRVRFRKNLERIGRIMAYEISRTFDYVPREVCSPLGQTNVMLPTNEIVLATLLRSGLPFHAGFLDMFDQADSSFISAYRKYHKDGSYSIEMDYVSSSSIKRKTLIIIDPLLATGTSSVKAFEALTNEAGLPNEVHFASVVATPTGVDHIIKHLSSRKVTIWTASLDQELTARSYIVPGIGDVGDLSFGDKI